MDKTRHLFLRPVPMILIILIVACHPQSTPTSFPTAGSTLENSPTSTITPSLTSAPTSTIAPSPTISTTPTPVIWSQAVIGPENAAQVKEINQWGNGSIRRMVSIQGGTEVVIRTFLGIYVYTLNPLAFKWMAGNALSNMAISPDENLLAVEYPNAEVRIYDIESGNLLHTLQHELSSNPSEIISITFSPTSDLLAVGFGNGVVDVWNVRRGASVAHLAKDIAPLPYKVAFAHSGKMLISSDNGYGSFNRYGYNLLWDLDTQKPIILIPNGGSLNEKAFSPDDTKYITVVDLYVVTYQVPSGAYLYKYGIGKAIRDTFYTEDGSKLIVQVDSGYQVRDAATGRLVADANWQPEQVSFPSPDEILTAGYYSNLQGVTFLTNTDVLVWGEETNPYFLNLPEQVLRLVKQEVNLQSEFVTSPDGMRFAYCAGDKLWAGEVPSLSPKTIYPCLANTHLAISNAWIAWGTDTTLRAINPENGDIRTNFNGHIRAISMVSFSKDGKYLMSGTTDPDAKRYVEVLIWSLDPSLGILKIQDLPKTVMASAFSSDGKIAAFSYQSSSGIPVRVVDVSTGNNLALLGGINATALSFTPDGRLLAVGDSEGSISFYNRDTWKKVSTLAGHFAEIKGLVFSPDGKNLISFSQIDGLIKTWGMVGK
jgi:WD40 repeat protein